MEQCSDILPTRKYFFSLHMLQVTSDRTLQNEKWTAPADGHDTTGQYDPSIHSTTGVTSFSLSGHHQALDPMIFQAGQELGGIFDFKLDYNDGRPLGLGMCLSTLSF